MRADSQLHRIEAELLTVPRAILCVIFPPVLFIKDIVPMNESDPQENAQSTGDVQYSEDQKPENQGIEAEMTDKTLVQSPDERARAASLSKDQQLLPAKVPGYLLMRRILWICLAGSGREYGKICGDQILHVSSRSGLVAVEPRSRKTGRVIHIPAYYQSAGCGLEQRSAVLYDGIP